MKLSAVSLLIASAGIAQHVSASPIRVIVTEVTTNLRFGHALADAKGDNPIAHIHIMNQNHTQTDDAGRQAIKKPHRCGGKGRGSKLRMKAIAISNAFRHALGLPLIEHHHHAHHSHHPTAISIEQAKEGKEIHGGLIRILPMPFIGTPAMNNAEGEKAIHDLMMQRPHHAHHRFMHASFMRRIHHALMSLGPWEGRAVAFVLGCGIGVLLRMFWVLMVVSYRMIKGGPPQDDYAVLVLEEDSDADDEIMASPPQYTDEKVALIVDDDKPTA